jgi:alpha-mannosidase
MVPALKPVCRISALLVILFAALFSVDFAVAQSAEDAAKIAATLPPASRAVMERLSTLHELPDGIWKIHSGDLPHGEAADLDESSWQTIAVLDKAPNDAVWFRQTYVIPETLNGYDLTGSRISFQFHAAANGPMPQILYFNGRRVAMGDDLEPVTLYDQAKPGDKVTVAVKLLHTVDAKTFRGATLSIEFPQNRPNPEDLREEFLSAALLVPSLAPGDAEKVAILNAAIQTVDLAALDASEAPGADARTKFQTEFDASLTLAQTKLEVLKPLLQQATFHLTGNSHIDAAWLWPWTETVDVVKRTFGTALQLMYEYPGYTYTQSAAAYNDWMAQKYPDMNAEIAQRINEGRWEVVGGMWVEPDLNMPDGESLVRQLLVGKRWYKQHYGVDVRVGWNPDSFGYTWQLPQIYKKSGIDYFVTQKMHWNDTNQLPFKLFWWQSPDGSKVLAYFPHDYSNDNLNPVRLSADLAQARTRATGMTDMMDLYGIGDHGGGPTRAILDEGFHWTDPSSNIVQGVTAPVTPFLPKPCLVSGHDFPGSPASPGLARWGGLSRADSAPLKDRALAPEAPSNCHITPKYEFGTALQYFSSIETQLAPTSPVWNYQSIARGYTPPSPIPGMVDIPTWKSELYFEYHRGVFTTQANHKANMRQAEVEVLDAEKWASLAWLDGHTYPGDELTEDWKKVLFNQFHDLAAGSGIGVIYKDAQKDYDVVRWSTNEITSGSLDKVAEKIDTVGDGVPVVITNPLGWARSGDVHVKVQLSQADGGALFVADGAGKVLSVPLRTNLDPKTGVADLAFHVADVPALGYKVVRIVAAKRGVVQSFGSAGPADALSISGNGIAVEVNKDTGCITSLQLAGSHGGTEYETLARGGCGNELQAFKDTPKNYDAWNIDPGTLDAVPILIDKANSVTLLDEETPSPKIRVVRTWQDSKFVQTISIPKDSHLVDIDNDIDWHESHVLLKAAFPLAATSPFATYEIPYGTIDRPTTRNNSWEQAQFEVPAMRWADLSGPGADGKIHGLSILNDSKYGYDAVGNTLRITLLRSPKWPDPDADMGHHHFHYALYPHSGTWKDALTVRHGYEYNYPLTAVVTTAHPGTLPASHSFASVEPGNVVLTAVKKAEDANGLIFRIYEWAGKQSTAEFHVPLGATSATVTNLMETPEGDPLPVTHEDGNDLVKAPIHPYEILTIRVDYPARAEKP